MKLSCGGVFMPNYLIKKCSKKRLATEYLLLFTVGGILYPLMESVYRGYSHWSMALAGGICLCAVHLINTALGSSPLLIKCAASAVFSTETEFLLGCILNIALKMDIWDYSELKFNVLGQICPQFTFIWFMISVPALFISRMISQAVKNIFEKG